MKRKLTASLVLASAIPACAVAGYEPIPDESGLSGYVNVGLNNMSVSSNLIAETASNEVSDDPISSLKGPSSNTITTPALTGELRYTFADTRTQIFFGSLLEDILTFETGISLGVRQEFDGIGGFSFAAVTEPAITSVWEDPYVTGANRKKTDRTANGFRLSWERILGSGLEVTLSKRTIDVDDENSGAALGLSAADRKLLDRNGDVTQFEVGYAFNLGDRGILLPSVTIMNRDIDGEALAGDGYKAQVSYLFKTGRWNFVSNLLYSTWEADEANPIPAFNNTKDDWRTWGGSVSAFYSEPFGWKGWNANATVGIFDRDQKIDFYDSDAQLLSLGMMYKF